MKNIAVCLWLNGQAEEAAKLYSSIFDDAKVTRTTRYHGERSMEVSGKPEGAVMTVEMELGGLPLMLLNGGTVCSPRARPRR